MRREEFKDEESQYPQNNTDYQELSVG